MSTTYKIPKEFITWIAEVMEMGANKHGDENWKQFDGNKSSHKDMHDSMFHHLAASYAGDVYTSHHFTDPLKTWAEPLNSHDIKSNLDLRSDVESGLDPLQHLAARALMTLYRKHKGLP